MSLTEALNSAWSTLLNKSPKEITATALVKYNADVNQFIIKFIADCYIVDLNLQKVLRVVDKVVADDFTAVIILHYLINAKPLPITNELITFRELSGGALYYPVFYKHSILPLVTEFAQNNTSLQKFISIAKSFDAEELNYGDASVRLFALPRLPLTIILWLGEEEEEEGNTEDSTTGLFKLEGSANILFERNANQHLPTEDLSKLAMLLVSKFIKQKRAEERA